MIVPVIPAFRRQRQEITARTGQPSLQCVLQIRHNYIERDQMCAHT